MAYNFPKDGIYSIKQAQKRLELSDDDLEQCLANSWLRLALPKSVITGATVGHFAALPFDQEENLPAEHQDLIAALCPLPDYLYNVGEHGPTGAVVFNDFSQNSFLLTAVRRYTTSASADDTEVKSPLSGYGELDTNAKTKTLADPATLWHLAKAICGEEYGFDPDAIIEGEMVVTGEEIARFINEYETAVTEETNKESKTKSYERLNEQGPPCTAEEGHRERTHYNKDPYLQYWANIVVREIETKTGRKPSKKEVARELLRDNQLGIDPKSLTGVSIDTVAKLLRASEWEES